MHPATGIAQELQGNYENDILYFHKFVIKTRKIPCFKQGQGDDAGEVS
jgi:hypothetical protein